MTPRARGLFQSAELRNMTKENSATTSFASPLHAPATLDSRAKPQALSSRLRQATCPPTLRYLTAQRASHSLLGTSVGLLAQVRWVRSMGSITNDVTKLEVGRGMYAAALTPKGKVLADLAVLRIQPETFLVESSASAGAEWFAMVRKYVNPRLAQYTDESATLSVIALCGPHAARVLARAGSASGGGAMVTDALTDALSAVEALHERHMENLEWRSAPGTYAVSRRYSLFCAVD